MLEEIRKLRTRLEEIAIELRSYKEADVGSIASQASMLESAATDVFHAAYKLAFPKE